MPEDLKVKKRGGGTEDWNYDKLLASINKAGISASDAEGIARQVESWAKQNAKDGAIESAALRDVVIEKMMADFPAEADSYKAYKKE